MSTSSYTPRLKQQYQDEVRSKLKDEFQFENAMEIPGLDKIVLNMGLGEASKNIKILETALVDLRLIAGQQPVITRAKKSIAAFKLRDGMPIGCRVTLRRDNMWHFLDRLVSVALPRVRDFRGTPSRSFDGRGSYTLGIRDHLIFPEVEHGSSDTLVGMNITFVTSAENDEHAAFLLRALGMPLRTN